MSAIIQSYVVGFLFDKYLNNVILIEKLKPEWQRGLFNGVGGKIEHGETPHEAMIREFKEEAGLSIPHWDQVAKVRWPGAIVYFFKSQYPYELTEARSMTDEQIMIVPVPKIPELRVIDNLKWLVPLAVDGGFLADVQSRDYETGW